MSGSSFTARTNAPMRTIRDEVLRSQLRPVVALAVSVAAVLTLVIIAQYAWYRLQTNNPLDELDLEELRQVLSVARQEQWPVLGRWLSVYGLGMSLDDQPGTPATQATLLDGRKVALSDVLSVVHRGRRLDGPEGRMLGPAPQAWQEAIEQLGGRSSARLEPRRGEDPQSPAGWPVALVRLDGDRVAALASPAIAAVPQAVVQLVLTAFAATSVLTAGFVSLFLFALRRRFAARSAERLSGPIERLAAAVRQSTRDVDNTYRVQIEAPAEVAQLAADFNLLQDQLARALRQRQQVIEGQRELVATLSHELRTPLAVLRGHAEILSREDGNAERAAVMLRQVEDLHHLLSDLLDMARLDSIEATLTLTEVPLLPVVEEMVARFAAPAWRQGVLLRVAAQAEVPVSAQADPRWLRQIVANLLSNAIRHTPPGGLVSLSAKAAAGQALLTIEDTGIGLNLSRAQQDLASRSAGIGLGVVRRLAAAMRGSLGLETSEDGGTRATLRLPLAPTASGDHDGAGTP